MATSGYPLYQPYQPTGYQAPQAPGSYGSTTNPRQIANNQLQSISAQGNQYQTTDQNLANQYAQQAQGTQNFLNPIEQNLAAGGGGYTQDEQSQIELSPQDKQNIITGAGISAGANTASGVGAADRAAAAAGGNPAAVAAYRARAAQTEGAQAGDAMTQARIAAQQAGSAGAQAVGQAAMNQQAQGTGYLGNLQAQQSQQGLSEQGLAQGAYGTQTTGTNQAAQTGLQASQTPSTLDKIAGGVAGALPGLASAGFLADGAPGDGTSHYLEDGGMDAVLGEAGPEVIVEATKNDKYLDDGYMGGGDMYAAAPTEGPSINVGDNIPLSSAAQPTMGSVKGPSWGQQVGGALQNYLKGSQSGAASPTGATPTLPPAWNSATPWQQLGTGIGTAANDMVNGPGSGSYLADGGMHSGFHWSQRQPRQLPRPAGGFTPLNFRAKPMMADGGSPAKLIRSPTHVKLDPGDKVVPLSFRPKAKIRPSAALPALSHGVTA